MGRQRKHYDIEELNQLVQNVSHNLRQLREKQGISQAELGRRSKVAHSTINEIESGIASDIQFSTVCQLARGLNVRVFDLLAGSDLSFEDPDRHEFGEAVEILEGAFKTLDRLRKRLQN
jgi:transcriptional regulator with XRE-family HTH domain